MQSFSIGFCNKKGGLPDVIFFIVVIFLFAIISVVGWTIFKVIDDEFQSSSQISDQGKTISSDLRGKYVGLVDNSFLMVFIGLFVAIAIGAWFIRTSPALFWFSIPIMAFIIFIGALYSNFFRGFSTDANFGTSFADFTILAFIMNNFVYVLTIIVLVVAALLYAKNSSQQV